jgi:hypothetical protein
MKAKKFSLEIYRHAMWLISPCTPEEALGWLKKKVPEGLDVADAFENSDAMTITSSIGELVFLPDYKDSPACISTLVHELTHVAKNVLNSRGVQEKEETEEVLAYMIGYLTEKCIKHLRKQAAGKLSENQSLPESTVDTLSSP